MIYDARNVRKLIAEHPSGYLLEPLINDLRGSVPSAEDEKDMWQHFSNLIRVIVRGKTVGLALAPNAIRYRGYL